MPSWKKVITSGSNATLNSLYVTGGVTGSLLGTASYANYALSASYALTASYSNNLQISGSVNNVDYIDFNTGSAIPAWKSGRIFWDNVEGALSVYNAEADITLQVGQENWTRIYNDTGAPIANGAPVRIIGTHGDHPEVVLAQSIQVSGSSNLVNQVLGLATHTIENGTFGYVTTQGLVRGVDTSMFADGDTLYVSSSAGTLTAAVLGAPYEIIPVGQVVKSSPGGSGIIYVAVQQPLDFTDLSSVWLGAGTYQDGDIWTYNGPNKRWEHKKQLSGSYGLTGSLTATSFTGSLFGTSSYARQALSSSFAVTSSYAILAQTSSYVLQAVSASFASTASYVNTLNQNIIVTGSATIASTTIGASENTLTLGPSPAGGSGEGGQLGLNAAGGTYTSASFIDVWQNYIRILRGSNASSDALVTQWNLHTKQMQLPAYTAASSFPGTATANLAVDSGGNVITVSTSGGSVFPYTGNAVITGSLTTTGIIYAQPNGGMYFQGGDDAALYDINISNHIGIYGVQDSTIGSIKLGSGGGIISGKGNNIGIGTTNPTNGTLEVNGNVYATSFTGSILGTASYATQALSASYAPGVSKIIAGTNISISPTVGTGDVTINATVASTFPYTGSAIISGSLELSGSFKVQGNGDGFSGPFAAITIDDVNYTRKLHDSQTGSGSLDFSNRDLLDNTGNGVFNWAGVASTIDSRLYLNQTISSTVRDSLVTNVGYGGFALNDVTFDTSVQQFDLVFLDTDGIWYQVNQGNSSSTKMLGICNGYNPMTYIGTVITEGDVVVTTGAGYPQVQSANYGLPVYIRESAGTVMSTAIPTTGYVRLLGHCYHNPGAGTEWIMKFRPSHEWIEL